MRLNKHINLRFCADGSPAAVSWLQPSDHPLIYFSVGRVSRPVRTKTGMSGINRDGYAKEEAS
jgi:hypothetical protein